MSIFGTILPRLWLTHKYFKPDNMPEVLLARYLKAQEVENFTDADVKTIRVDYVAIGWLGFGANFVTRWDIVI